MKRLHLHDMTKDLGGMPQKKIHRNPFPIATLQEIAYVDAFNECHAQFITFHKSVEPDVKEIDNILAQELDSHYTSDKHRWQIATRIAKGLKFTVRER